MTDQTEHVCRPDARRYFCPASGETESDCHGGFGTCCDQVGLHQQMLKCSAAHLRQQHGAHSWEPQPGMKPVRCEGYGAPAATEATAARTTRCGS